MPLNERRFFLLLSVLTNNEVDASFPSSRLKKKGTSAVTCSHLQSFRWSKGRRLRTLIAPQVHVELASYTRIGYRLAAMSPLEVGH